MPEWSQLRSQFPALKSWTYLDTASFGQLPVCASEAITGHLTHRDQTASSQYMSWFDHMDALREKCAKLINCAAADIAFVPSASTGLSCLMHGLNWKPGDEVLTLSDEFPNQLYQGPPATRFGAVFRAVRWPDFYASINERTRLVLLSTVNYANGFRPPVEEIAPYLRQRGIRLYLDGTQSVGALKFDVQAIRPAMLCVDAYKWMMSPNGAGFFYIDPELRPHLPPSVVGWRSDAAWREVNNLNHADPIFPDSAQKYEGGMLCLPSLYALSAVISLLLQVGMSHIEARVLDLASKTRAMLTDLGGEVDSNNSQIVTARLPGRDADATARLLRSHQVVVSARRGWLRISPHFYNNEEDLESLRQALGRRASEP
jgi:cysteine desulfurase/selenocysteine lyase